MNFISIRALICAVCVVAATAQITFSRDWTGGKRSLLPVDCAQFTTLCRHLVHELKRTMTPEKPSKRRRPDDDTAFLYDDQ